MNRIDVLVIILFVSSNEYSAGHKSEFYFNQLFSHFWCVGHHYAQTNTNTVNKKWVPLQTTGGHARRTEHCWNTLSVLLSNEMTFPSSK
jgi:hypothetical protein